MTAGRKPLTASVFMIIMMKIFSGLTLACHPAEYQIGNECCPKCPAGTRVRTHCTEFRSTSCLPCLDGTYMDKPNGLQQCAPCTNCDSGSGLQIKRKCTAISDTVCEPLEGFYCVDPSGDDCGAAQKHKRCDPGQYISQKGTASTDTECSDCSSGTFSDGTLTSCQPHTQCESLNLQLIIAGTVSTDALCGGQIVNTVLIIVIIVTLVFFLLLAISAYLFYKRRCLAKTKNQNQNQNQNTSLIQEENPPPPVTTRKAEMGPKNRGEEVTSDGSSVNRNTQQAEFAASLQSGSLPHSKQTEDGTEYKTQELPSV